VNLNFLANARCSYVDDVQLGDVIAVRLFGFCSAGAGLPQAETKMAALQPAQVAAATAN